MLSSSSLLRLSVVIACLCLLVHAGPAPTLKRHNHKKASRLEEPLPQTYPPALTDALDVPKDAQATNATDLSDSFKRINDSLKSIITLVEERVVELQTIIKESQNAAQAQA
jgi:hypothetical protein